MPYRSVVNTLKSNESAIIFKKEPTSSLVSIISGYLILNYRNYYKRSLNTSVLTIFSNIINGCYYKSNNILYRNIVNILSLYDNIFIRRLIILARSISLSGIIILLFPLTKYKYLYK